MQACGLESETNKKATAWSLPQELSRVGRARTTALAVLGQKNSNGSDAECDVKTRRGSAC